MKYIVDYTNNTENIDNVFISTNESGLVNYPFIIGIIDMAKGELINGCNVYLEEGTEKKKLNRKLKKKSDDT
jgi:hypothetical protein